MDYRDIDRLDVRDSRRMAERLDATAESREEWAAKNPHLTKMAARCLRLAADDRARAKSLREHADRIEGRLL